MKRRHSCSCPSALSGPQFAEAESGNRNRLGLIILLAAITALATGLPATADPNVAPFVEIATAQVAFRSTLVSALGSPLRSLSKMRYRRSEALPHTPMQSPVDSPAPRDLFLAAR
jgi:hypothetical protein